MRRALKFGLIGGAVLLFLLLVVPFLIPIPEDGTDPRVYTDEDGRFISVDGINTYLIEKGDPSAPSVVFVHGLYGSTWVWRNNADALAAMGLRVVLFDRPGAGLSDKPDEFDYSHRGQADFIARLLDMLSIPSASVVGHSAGGGVAAHFALRHPDRLDKLVLVDPALVGASGPPPFVGTVVGFPPIYRWGRIGLQALLTEERLRESVSSFYADPDFLTDVDFVGYWRPFTTPRWEVGLLNLTRDSAANRLTPQQIGQISAPTLILWGEVDRWTPLANAAELQQLISGSQVITYPEVGHQPMEENAAAFNRDVGAFLRGG